jgi:hypothetical protein
VSVVLPSQTGSGKTYTMEGPVNADEYTQGMIPRALQQVFASSRDLNEKGWIYKMEASFIEIYNETLHDLLAVGKRDLKHDIRIDPKNQGEVYVTNITPVLITSEQQTLQPNVEQWLQQSPMNVPLVATVYFDSLCQALIAKPWRLVMVR